MGWKSDEVRLDGNKGLVMDWYGGLLNEVDRCFIV